MAIMADIDRSVIEDVVRDIVYNFGSERHIDGLEEITAFIQAVLDGRGEDWISKFYSEVLQRPGLSCKFYKRFYGPEWTR